MCSIISTLSLCLAAFASRNACILADCSISLYASAISFFRRDSSLIGRGPGAATNGDAAPAFFPLTRKDMDDARLSPRF